MYLIIDCNVGRPLPTNAMILLNRSQSKEECCKIKDPSNLHICVSQRHPNGAKIGDHF